MYVVICLNIATLTVVRCYEILRPFEMLPKFFKSLLLAKIDSVVQIIIILTGIVAS